MIRTALRKPAVLKALGIGNTAFYDKIQKGFIPRGTKIDPEGRVVIWWSDEIEGIQEKAVKAAAEAAKASKGDGAAVPQRSAKPLAAKFAALRERAKNIKAA